MILLLLEAILTKRHTMIVAYIKFIVDVRKVALCGIDHPTFKFSALVYSETKSSTIPSLTKRLYLNNSNIQSKKKKEVNSCTDIACILTGLSEMTKSTSHRQAS